MAQNSSSQICIGDMGSVTGQGAYRHIPEGVTRRGSRSGSVSLNSFLGRNSHDEKTDATMEIRPGHQDRL